METELQDGGLAVYPRIKVLFQPMDRTHPNVLWKAFHNCSIATHRPSTRRPLLLGGHDGRIRQGNGAQNMAILRHMALNLLRREAGHKRGIKARRKRAGWDRDYLLQVLTG